MMSKEKGKVETVNLPPSAAGMLDAYLTVIRTEATASPLYKSAVNELRQMAGMVDMMNYKPRGFVNKHDTNIKLDKLKEIRKKLTG